MQVGTDLFANWCDDVIDSTEPTPIVDGRFALDGGRLTIDSNATGAGCGEAIVNGLLRDGSAMSIGEPIEFPDELILTNTSWGCFAG